MRPFLRFFQFAVFLVVFAAAPAGLVAQNAAASGTSAPHATESLVGHLNAADHASDRLTDRLLFRFGIDPDSNTGRYLAAAVIVLLAFLLRRVVIRAFFALLNRLVGKSEGSLYTKLSNALEKTLSLVVLIIGFVVALKVLHPPAAVNTVINYAHAFAIMLAVFWFALRVTGAVADYLHALARKNELGVAAFMPWIKNALMGIVFVFGALMIAQGMGANVGAFLAGLGIGGLALALAAQDTVANVFGAVVVAIDQPFRIGETVQIGAFIGTVEQVGIRSTRLRTPQKTLVTIPNKTMASESIVNLSRITQRRVEITVGLTYDTNADQLEEIVEEIRRIVKAEDAVDQDSVVVQFTNFGASSLDIWLLFMTKTGDFVPHLQARQRISLAIMRAVEQRGLSFAFPTQTLELGASAARALVKKAGGPKD